MKAAAFRDYGQPDVLTYDDVADPQPSDGEVLVRVRAAGINPLDWKLRSGAMQAMMPLPLPFILGWDVCGEVDGDRVMALLPFGRPGAYAERVAAPSSLLVPVPADLSDDQAAALPIVGLAARQAVHTHGQVAAGQTVMVLGAAGVVGTLACQLAGAAAASRIIAVARKSQLDGVRAPVQARMASEDGDFSSLGRSVDLVVDTIGGPLQAAALRTLAPGGRLVTTVQPPDQALATELGVTAVMMGVEADTAGLTDLAALVAAGTLSLPPIETYPLSAAAQAHADGEAGRFAKAVLHPAG